MTEIRRDSGKSGILVFVLIAGTIGFSLSLVQYFKSSALLRAYNSAPGCLSTQSTEATAESSKSCSVSREKITDLEDKGMRPHTYSATVSNGTGRRETVGIDENGYLSLAIGHTVEVQRFSGAIMKITDGGSVVISERNPQSGLNSFKNSLFVYIPFLSIAIFAFVKQRKRIAGNSD